MADETTYESEMSQAVHRPGMEGVVNRGVDQDGNRTGDRPTVAAGKTDPFSVKGDGPVKGGAPKPAAADNSEPTMARPGGGDPIQDAADKT